MSTSSTVISAVACFWRTEADVERVPSFSKVHSGYTGGHVSNPTYNQVRAGATGHSEAVRVAYDWPKVWYAQLLDVFWHNTDPTVRNAQFCDMGNQYLSGIDFLDDAQRRAA